MNFEHPLTTTNGETLGIITAVICVLISLVLIPFLLFRILITDIKRYNSAIFENKYRFIF